MAEPLLLGLLLAPTVAGWFLALAVVGVFLIYQPLQLALKDHLKGKRYARTPWAERFALGYGALAFSGLIGAVLTTRSAFWLPVLVAFPIAGLQTFLVIRIRLRRARGEDADRLPAMLASLAAVMIAGAGLIAGLLPWTAVVAMALLTARAAFYLYLPQRPVRTAIIGVQEVGFGVLTVLLVVLGFRM